MLYREIIVLCSQNHTEHINRLCGQNVDVFSVKRGGTYSKHLAVTVNEICGTVSARFSGGGILNITFVCFFFLLSPQLLSEKFLFLRRIYRDIIMMYRGLHVKYTLFRRTDR